MTHLSYPIQRISTSTTESPLEAANVSQLHAGDGRFSELMSHVRLITGINGSLRYLLKEGNTSNLVISAL